TVYEQRGYAHAVYEQRGFAQTVYEQRGYAHAVYEQRGFAQTVYEQRGFAHTVHEQRGYAHAVYEQREFAHTVYEQRRYIDHDWQMTPIDFQGTGNQTFYVIDEAELPGKGAGCVISLVHHYFKHHGYGEKNAQAFMNPPASASTPC
ncbi:hypothetical protein DPMN_043195, partial [Dreissena polymorpha]